MEQKIEQPQAQIELAAGYAVLLRRDGYSEDDIKLLLTDTYQLSFEEADRAWKHSLKQYAATHKKVARETVFQIGGTYLITAIILLLYSFIWFETSNSVAIFIYVLIGFFLLGFLLFIKEYLSLSFPLISKCDLSDNNKLAAFAPTLIVLTILLAGRYIFHAGQILENEGEWIRKVTIENYGERGSTGGKSRSRFTMMRIENFEQPFRFFDYEVAYAIVPLDSFSLKSGEIVDIFVHDPSLFSLNNHRNSIINIRQKNLMLTSFEHRNRLVNEANEKRLLYTSIFTILYMIVCVIYGRYLFHKNVLSATLTRL